MAHFSLFDIICNHETTNGLVVQLKTSMMGEKTMKKLVLFAVFIVGLVLIQGCASTQVAKDLNDEKIATTGTNVAHVYGNNWGLYCLSIPMITGSTEKPGSVSWFSDDSVNVSSVVKMVTAKTKALGATSTLDIKSNTSSFWIFPTFVLFIRTVEVSGNGIK